jgi:ubiquinone/menaquinone biosynthesis C-methylase UbiE
LLAHADLELAPDGSPVDTSYGPFSQRDEYVDLNRRFVESVDWAPYRRVVDVACGTATLTELIWRLRQLCPMGASSRFVAIDQSAEALRLAARRLASLGISDASVLVRGVAQALPVRDECADAVIMGNAIHLVDDKDAALAEFSRITRLGGMFMCNSSFFAGTFPEGTESFYTDWLKEALAYISRKDAAQRASGLPGITRARGRGRPAFSNRWLSPEEYRELLERHGFSVDRLNCRTVTLSREALESIGSYAGLGGVLLSGYPVAVACEALAASVASTLARANLTCVPRYWLELVAVRR